MRNCGCSLIRSKDCTCLYCCNKNCISSYSKLCTFCNYISDEERVGRHHIFGCQYMVTWTDKIKNKHVRGKLYCTYIEVDHVNVIKE